MTGLGCQTKKSSTSSVDRVHAPPARLQVRSQYVKSMYALPELILKKPARPRVEDICTLWLIAERFLQPGTEFAQKLPLDSSWYKGIDLGDYGLSHEEVLKRSTGKGLGSPFGA